MNVSTPTLPNIARGMLKGCIVTMANVGVITGADAELLIALLEPGDA